jgi:hypothetical protein
MVVAVPASRLAAVIRVHRYGAVFFFEILRASTPRDRYHDS